eukprot:239887-Amphidinium_carterae.1
MEHHPSWSLYRDSWIGLLDDPAAHWSQRWAFLLQAMKCAASDLRCDCSVIPSGNPHVDRHYAMRALRFLLT